MNELTVKKTPLWGKIAVTVLGVLTLFAGVGDGLLRSLGICLNLCEYLVALILKQAVVGSVASMLISMVPAVLALMGLLFVAASVPLMILQVWMPSHKQRKGLGVLTFLVSVLGFATMLSGYSVACYSLTNLPQLDEILASTPEFSVVLTVAMVIAFFVVCLPCLGAAAGMVVVTVTAGNDMRPKALAVTGTVFSWGGAACSCLTLSFSTIASLGFAILSIFAETVSLSAVGWVNQVVNLPLPLFESVFYTGFFLTLLVFVISKNASARKKISED